MISNSIINAKSFICCLCYQGPNETFQYYNDKNGHYHSYLYTFEGLMEVYADEAKLADPEVGILYDISHTHGKQITSNTQLQGCSFVTFNPVPIDRKLNINIVKDKQTIEISATDKRVTIVCFTGPVKVNDKTLNSTQYAVVFPGKTATLSMEENNICALVSE